MSALTAGAFGTRVGCFAAALALAASLGPGAAAAQPGRSACEAAGDVQFVCGPSGPEDLIRVPGTDWIVVSWLRGGLYALDIPTRALLPLYTAVAGADRFDRETYGAVCSGPPTPEQRARYGTVGVTLRPGADGLHTIYTLGRRQVEIFELDLRAAAPAATWIGCVAPPPDTGMNSLAPTPVGGFVMSTWQPPNGGPDARARMEAGEINGSIWEWHPADGWFEIPGSETSGANGVEISPDGRYVYFAGWGNRTFNRVTRGAVPPRRDTVQLDFRMDNMHWGPAGKLIAGGHRDAGINDSRVARIDPQTLEVVELLRRDDDAAFAHSTAAAQIADELWLGSSLGGRIAIVPLRQ